MIYTLQTAKALVRKLMEDPAVGPKVGLRPSDVIRRCDILHITPPYLDKTRKALMEYESLDAIKLDCNIKPLPWEQTAH